MKQRQRTTNLKGPTNALFTNDLEWEGERDKAIASIKAFLMVSLFVKVILGYKMRRKRSENKAQDNKETPKLLAQHYFAH